MALRVRDVMRADVVSVSPESTLEDLEEVLLRHRIGSAPVVEDGRVVGIVSRSDFVRQLAVERSRLESSAATYLEPSDAEAWSEGDQERLGEAAAARLASLRVEDVMVRDVVALDPGASLAELAQRMVERGVHHVVVQEAGALVGIVSAFDLVRLVAEGKLGGAR